MTLKVAINKEGANEKRKYKKRYKRKTKIQKKDHNVEMKEIDVKTNMTKRHSEEKR